MQTPEEREEEVLRLAQEIGRLRSDLRDREQRFRALIGGTEATDIAPPRKMISPDISDGKSAAEQMRDFFRANPDRIFTVKQLRDAMPGLAAKLIRSTAHRLAGEKFGMPGLISPGRGRYRFRTEASAGQSVPSNTSLFPGAIRRAGQTQ